MTWTVKRLPLDQVLHIRIFGSRRDYGIQILQYRESFRLVLFPSRNLFSWKHKLEVKEVHLSEDIPGSTGLCTLSCFRERELARELRSPSLTSIIMGFKRLEGVPRYLICFLATQYILRNLLCSKTWLLINWPIIRLIYCWDIERRGCFQETSPDSVLQDVEWIDNPCKLLYFVQSCRLLYRV